MATATEVITDIITLRYNGNFSTYDFHMTNNRISGAVVSNYIYKIPAGKVAEVIVHQWNERDGFNYLGRLMMGWIREGTNSGYRDLRYAQTFDYDVAFTNQSLNYLTPIGVRFSQDNQVFIPKDNRFFLDENMYIFRESGAAANFGPESGIDLWWDITVILRNKP